MKNKTLKNLIAISAFAVFVFSASSAYAAIQPYSSNWTVPVSSNDNSNYYQQYNYPQQYDYNGLPVPSQYVYGTQQQQVQYVQQPQVVQYVQQPQVKYVPVSTQQVQYVQQPQIQYVPATQTTKTVSTTSSQGASVASSNANKVAIAKNTGVTGNTGQYVNYDANNQNMMLASAYGAYNNQPVSYDSSNGVTALTVKGSGSFMPSSVFQWFLIVLLILAIVIVARMLSKTFSKDSHQTPVH